MLLHVGKKRYSCEFCDFSTSTCRLFTAHQCTQANYIVYYCTWCDYECRTLHGLRVHERKHSLYGVDEPIPLELEFSSHSEGLEFSAHSEGLEFSSYSEGLAYWDEPIPLNLEYNAEVDEELKQFLLEI